ncbi:hypothetical protein [Streptomonospora alba]|uniref:hypothetical protein n=1 Tax=Streptomonospora alba TaxID=183763 RepID=UPI0012ECDCBE|nr:hypothetical protein [Streptomonospora alba]
MDSVSAFVHQKQRLERIGKIRKRRTGLPQRLEMKCIQAGVDNILRLIEGNALFDPAHQPIVGTH